MPGSRTMMGWAAMAVIACVAFVLHHDLGLYAFIGNIHDDALFFRLATYIRRGEWLGPYGQMTLAKGPMFPILIAGSWWAGASIKDVEFVVFLAAAATMAMVVKRFSGSWSLTIVLFAALALDPLHWDMSMMRLLREPLYEALSLAVVALAAVLVLDEPGRSRRRRIALAVVLGLTFAAYWLTREESSWLYPALAVILAHGLYCIVRSDPASRRRSAVSFLLLGAVSGSAFVAGLLPVKALNWFNYGTTDTTEYRAGPFQDAYGALARIEVEHPSRYVPIPRAARLLAYGVSPTARELRPYLEGGVGRMWTGISCWAIGNTLCASDMAGGWFMWALRDATAVAGYYATAQDASAFYARMAREIDAACDGRRIPCGAPRHTFAPPLEGGDVGPLAHSMLDALSMVSRLEARPIGPLTSPGDPAKLAAWQKGLGRVAPPESAQMASSEGGRSGRGPGEALKFHIVDAGAGFIGSLLPFLWATAVLGLGMHLVFNRRERSSNAVATLATACFTAVLTRAFITAYLDVTSWTHAVNHLYLSPSYGFGVVFAVCGSYLLVRAVHALRATRSPAASS